GNFPHTAIKVVEMFDAAARAQSSAQRRVRLRPPADGVSDPRGEPRRTCRRIRPEPLRAHRVAMDRGGWPALLRSVVDAPPRSSSCARTEALAVLGASEAAERSRFVRS